MEQLRAQLDPKHAHPDRKPYSRDKKSQLQLEHYRLSPADGVLEFRANIHFAIMWAPYLPYTKCTEVVGKDVSRRRWA